MRERWQKTKGFILGFILLSVTSLGFGQTSSLDHERMNRDLRIMEGILDELLKGRSSDRYIEGATKGVYLQGFGLVFHTEHETFRIPGIVVWDTYKDQMKRIREELATVRGRVSRQKEAALEAVRARAESFQDEEADTISDLIEISVEENEEDRQKAVESVKESILVFFRNYVSAIGQLRPQDRVAVLVELDGWDLTDERNGFLTAVVKKQDVDRYRRHRVEDSDFEKLVHFRQGDSDGDIDRDIDIMSEILHRALRESFHWRGFSPGGLYLEDLGAVFFLDLSGMSLLRTDDEDYLAIITARDVDRAIAYSYGKDEEKEKDKREKKREDLIQEVRDELLEILGSYGHTLRLKPQERVIVDVDLGRHGFYWSSPTSGSTQKAVPQYLILQITKQDLDAYDGGRISLEELQNRSVFQTL